MVHSGKAQCIRSAIATGNDHESDDPQDIMYCHITVNCVDRHAIKHPDRVALIWEKDEPGEVEEVTYK